MGLKATKIEETFARPVLKWAGGKSQLLTKLTEATPKKFNKYIEPFFGGGALFFHLQPGQSVIADSNPELVNLYRCIAKNPVKVIEKLSKYKNQEDFFYKLRAKKFDTLEPYEAAARTVFLNKTCFNGLYRVNKTGHFNVPFGRYKNPNLCDAEALVAASKALRNATIASGDYKTILKEHAREGDFIFLDPPYLPISKYADFKRYTKDQFYEEDHRDLANEVRRLHELGCYVVLTNSNHPLVHELYGDFKIEIVQTKRYINCNAENRTGEDVLVTIPPKKLISLRVVPDALNEQVLKYPSTRWMGSKSKLLTHLQQATKNLQYESVIDLFSGSGIVGYMFKSLGKQVISNDYMALSAVYTKAMIENNSKTLPVAKAKTLLLPPNRRISSFVQRTFAGLYFTDEENLIIDIIRANISKLPNQYERAIAKAALIRACTKKRPRGIFTYVGDRYNDGRKDLQISLTEHFIKAVKEINAAIFNNSKKNQSKQVDAMTIRRKADLVYMDPPYFSPLSDNEYVRRYHFIEGLACDWKGLEIQAHTKTKKFKSYPTPFSSRKGAYDAFDKLFKKFKDSILVVSYASNSLPTLDEIVGLMSKYKTHVQVVKVDYKYSFGNQKEGILGNDVQEYIFIGQ
ncbi:MAG: Dam family site-specific DNA-(adenine-N6)-methyltransferase [Patescibacteria group bacterium]